MVARKDKESAHSATDELERRLRGDASDNTSGVNGVRGRRHHQHSSSSDSEPAARGRDHKSSNGSNHSPLKTHVRIPATARRASILQRILNSTGRAPLFERIKRRSESDASSSDSDSSDDEKLPQTIRRRVSRIFLQRFLKKQDVACEADFCLYFEIATREAIEADKSNTEVIKDWVRRRTSSTLSPLDTGGPMDVGDADSPTSNDNDESGRGSSSSSERQTAAAPAPTDHTSSDVHTVIDITAMLLRDAGCQVMLYPLEHPDSELLPESKSDALAYVMTVGYGEPSNTTSSSNSSKSRSKATSSIPEGRQVHHHALPVHHQKLPPWVTLHPAYTKQILPLAGLAQTQQLTKLILKECRTDHNLFLANGELVFEAEKKVLSQLAQRDDLTIQLYPLHRDDFREGMIRKWSRHATYAPPLTDIYQYYGPKIAMYFAWLDFYTNMLVFPSICGICVYAAGHFNAQSYSLLSFLLAIGTSVFVDLWKRKQREVEYTWKYQEAVEPSGTSLVPGLVGMDYIETRPEFKGEWMNDPVTHEYIYDFPRHKRLFRQLLAIPLLLSMCCVVGAYVVGLNMLSENLRSYYRSCYLKHAVHLHHGGGDHHSSSGTGAGSISGPSPAFCAFISHGPGVLNALIIYIMDLMYQQLAWKLNEFENYRTAQEFEDNLVLKRMPFHFVNSNASIWFLAFYVQNLERVRERLWILMVGMQLLDNFKEVGLPFVVSLTGEFLTADGKRRRRRSSSMSTADSSEQLSPVTKASSGLNSINGNGNGNGNGSTLLRAMPELKRQHTSQVSVQERLARVLMQKRQAQYKDTFADYKEMMIQYGYVALYSPIFPLAPVFAWLNNVVESRSDFLKLVNTHSYQRPLVQHTRGIGVWENVLVAFSVLAVIINFALVYTYELDDLLPSWSDLHRFMFIVACEHLIFLVKVLLNWAAPDVPTWIQNEKRIAALHRTHEAAYAQHSEEVEDEGGSDSDSDRSDKEEVESESDLNRKGDVKPSRSGEDRHLKDIHPYAAAS